MQKKSLLAIAMAFSLLAAPFFSATAVRAQEAVATSSASGEDFATAEQSEELAALQKQEAQLAERQKQLDSEMQLVQAEVSALNAQNLTLNSQLQSLLAQGKILQTEYDNLKADLEAAKQTVRKAVEAYDKARADVDKKQAEYEKRLVGMFRRSKQSPLEVLLDSKGITGFFTNLQLLSVVGRSDKQVLQDLTDARATAEIKKSAAEESKRLYDSFVAKKKAEVEALAQGISLKQSDIAGLQSQILSRSGELSSLEADKLAAEQSRQAVDNRQDQILKSIQQQAEATIAARAEATRAAQAEATRAARAEAEAKAAREEAARKAAQGAANSGAGNNAPKYTNGLSSRGLVKPAPGNTYISYYFGWRRYPLNEALMDFHTGLDFPGNFGDPIVAVLPGTVIKAVYPFPNAYTGGIGYANYVMIQHDNGLQSLYAHLKTVEVSVGQRVEQGERIGGMGSTGYSTGCHLHFEIRLSNSVDSLLVDAVDPYNYLFG